MSTKLWVEDRTQYTETDGEEEEGITLGGGSTNREEGREIRNKTGSRDKRRKREAEWRRRSDWTDGGRKTSRGKERVGEEVGVGNGRRATAVKDKTGSIPWMSPVAKSGWGALGKSV